MTCARLSPLDASFLAIESPAAHMHVGWFTTCAPRADGSVPSFAELREHIGRRLQRAPRYRQKLAPVPLGLRAPEWVDDDGFSIDRHVYPASGPLSELIEEVMSMPLRRDRPLWEMWICHQDRAGFAIVCKAHHCMVDGLAAVELGSLLCDPTPQPQGCERDNWRARPQPRGEWLLARGLLELAGEQLGLVRWPLYALSSPRSTLRHALGGSLRLTRALTRSMRPAPATMFNAPLSPTRRIAWTERPFADLRVVRRAFGTTINDVILAAVAGGLRSYLMRRGEQPIALKVMVPVSVRCPDDVLGNHISFVFPELPCDEPDPLTRLGYVHAAMSRCKRGEEAEGTDLALKLAARTPAPVQRAVSRVVASPHTSNLVISNIPGPSAQLFIQGCAVRGAYPLVPLADGHAVSVAMMTIHDKACFGIHGDAETLADVEMLARDIDGAVADLVSRARVALVKPRSAEQRVAPARPPRHRAANHDRRSRRVRERHPTTRERASTAANAQPRTGR